MRRVWTLHVGWMVALALAVGCSEDDPVTPPPPTGCTTADDCPGEDTSCSARVCSAGTCSVELAPAAAACSEDGGAFCNDQGQCVECLADGDCTAGVCVDGSCEPRTNGEACASPTECQSGECVDGVCCESACTEACFACNVAGSEGVCSPQTGGTDPDGDCSVGICDGSGNCAVGALAWANDYGGNNADWGHDVAVDGQGRAVLYGEVGSNIDFGTGAISDPVFVVQFDGNGATNWARGFVANGLSNNDQRVAADASGNIFVAGTVNGDVNLGGATLTSGSTWNLYYGKLDSSGNHLWSNIHSANTSHTLGDIRFDADGNILLTGRYSDTIDFGGNPLTTEPNRAGLFVAKLDADGSHLWSHGFSVDGPGAWAITSDAAGNVFAAGRAEGSVDFGDGVTPSGTVYVLAYDAAGTLRWSRRYVDTDGGDSFGRKIAADAQGNVVVGGHLRGTVDFGGGPLTELGNDDLFVLKLDADGQHVWSARFGDPDNDEIQALETDASGNILLAGRFRDTLDFGGGALMTTGPPNVTHGYVAKLSRNGEHLWSSSMGGPGGVSPWGAGVDSAGAFIVGGLFDGSAAFGNQTLTSVHSFDLFLAKYEP